MGNLGNISGIKDFQALKAIQELDRKLDNVTTQVARLRQNSSTILTELSSVTMPELAQVDVPAHLANSGSIYTKDVSGITELYFKDSDGATVGREVRITKSGGLAGVDGTGTTNFLTYWLDSDTITASPYQVNATYLDMDPGMATFPLIKNIGVAVDLGDAVSLERLTNNTNTFNVVQVFSATPGIELTTGTIRSAVANVAAAQIYNFTPTNTLTAATDRWYFRLNTPATAQLFGCRGDTCFDFGSATTTGGFLNIGGTLNISGCNSGFYFFPTIQAAGVGISGLSGNFVIAGNFSGKDNTTGTNTSLCGGRFTLESSSVTKAYSDCVAGVFQSSMSVNMATTCSRLIGIEVGQMTWSGTSGTAPATFYGVWVQNSNLPVGGATNVFGAIIDHQSVTSGTGTATGLRLGQTTATYKALTIRDQNAWISSDATNDLDLSATTNVDLNGYVRFTNATNGLIFYDDEIVSYEDELVSDV